MPDPLVSIGIPSYNHEKYISETIESILNQTFQDFEIIITDDGSSDNTVNVIKKFSDPRIKLFVFDENQGACKALNNCIINSKGEYFAYVSSDDIWKHDKLEKQVKFLNENPSIQAVFTKVEVIDEDGKKFEDDKHFYANVFDQENLSRDKWLNQFFYRGNIICHPSIMIRKTVYDDIGLYDERMANLPDFDMWIRFCLKYNLHIYDEKLTKFRVRKDEENVSGNKPTTWIRRKHERLHTFDHYLKIDDIKFFLKIFPDAEKFGKLVPEMLPYFLARLAYEIKIDVYELWALNTLFNFMQSEEIVNKLEEEYNFGYPDFFEMSSKSDFFNVIKIRERDDRIHERDDRIQNNNKNIKILNNIIKEKNNSYKNLSTEIEDLRSNLFEIQYHKNYNRPFIQRVISKFPRLFILFNRNNHGFKNALINIKGFNAIKKNNLFDTGYYLKNNPDVRLSGKDPILHYIYQGYNENRNPNSSFDGNYYFKHNSDIKKSRINPLIHYSLYGITENRRFKPIKKAVVKDINNKEIDLITKKEIDQKKKEIIRKNASLLNLYDFKDDDPLVSLIILNKNGFKHLKRLFKNFEENLQYPSYEIIVVDNGSTDESVRFLEELQDDLPLKIIKNSENKSFSEANNDAVDTANGQYILLLNNDIEPTFGWLNEMMQIAYENNNVGAVGAKLVYPYNTNPNKGNDSFKIQHSGIGFEIDSNGMIEPFHLCKGLDAFHPNSNNSVARVGVTAAVLLVKKEIYKEVGGLDEGYYYGYEDVDFNLKLIKKGYSNIYCSKALLFHYENGTQETKEYKYLVTKFKGNEKLLFDNWYSWLYERIDDDIIFPRETC